MLKLRYLFLVYVEDQVTRVATRVPESRGAERARSSLPRALCTFVVIPLNHHERHLHQHVRQCCCTRCGKSVGRCLVPAQPACDPLENHRKPEEAERNAKQPPRRGVVDSLCFAIPACNNNTTDNSSAAPPLIIHRVPSLHHYCTALHRASRVRGIQQSTPTVPRIHACTRAPGMHGTNTRTSHSTRLVSAQRRVSVSTPTHGPCMHRSVAHVGTFH